MDPRARPLVAILCVNWNAGGRTVRWLENLRSIDYPRERLKVYIRDNHSADDSVDRIRRAIGALQQELPPTFFYAATSHPGVTAAFNDLLSYVDPECEVVIRVDNDVELAPDSVMRLIEVMLSDERHGVAGPRVMYAAERTKLNSGAVYINWWGGPNVLVDSQGTVECDVVLGCVMAFRRQLLDRLEHWFRPDLFFFGEEPESCFRARAAGYATVYVPDAVVYHDTKVGSGRHAALSAYLNIRNHVRFHAEAGPAAAYPVYACRTLAGVLWRAVKRRDMAEVRGFIDGILARPIAPSLWERSVNEAQRGRADA
jgi:GT2 family glycosyltransferase